MPDCRGSLGIAETHQVLVLNDLRSRVVLQTDGGSEDGSRCRDRGVVGCRGVRFFDRTADHARLHHDAEVPSEYLPGRNRDPGS